jgi:hypothetical protein
LQFEDYKKLIKFNTKQKQQLKEMWGLLRAKEDEKTQIEKIIALSILFILQSLKGFDQFNSLIVYFAAILGINKKGV